MSKEYRIQFAGASVPSKSGKSQSYSRSCPASTLTCGKLYFIHYIIRRNVRLLSFPCVGVCFTKEVPVYINVLPLVSSQLCATVRVCVQTHICAHIHTYIAHLNATMAQSKNCHLELILRLSCELYLRQQWHTC